jgi:hypothetical protein
MRAYTRNHHILNGWLKFLVFGVAQHHAFVGIEYDQAIDQRIKSFDNLRQSLHSRIFALPGCRNISPVTFGMTRRAFRRGHVAQFVDLAATDRQLLLEFEFALLETLPNFAIFRGAI